MITLETNRLTLRPFHKEDASEVQRMAGDVEIARTTLNVPHPYPDGAAEQFFEATHKAADEGRAFTFAVELKETGQLVGCIGLGIQAAHKRAEIAYWIGKEYWGHGYASEAARAVVRFGFTTCDLNRIYAFAMSHNPASTGVMKKVGMTYEGTFPQHAVKWGEFVDLVAYGMVKVDFERLDS